MSKKQKKQESERTQRRREERKQRKIQKLYEANLNNISSCESRSPLTDEARRSIKERNYDEESESLFRRNFFDSDEEMNEFEKTLESKGFTHLHTMNITDYIKKGYKVIDGRFPVSETEYDEAIEVVDGGGVALLYLSDDHIEICLRGKNGLFQIQRIFGATQTVAA